MKISRPGITHYSMDCDHIHNKKVRLLVSEFGADGYWIWSCLVAEAYRTNGYYFDCNDNESLELFATDVCKKQVALVKEVIAGCIRRSLFDKGVFDVFGVLSGIHMQETYIKATKERRKKGTSVTLREDYLLVAVPENEVNITITPRTKAIIPRTNGKTPGTDSQSKVKNSRVIESTISTTSPNSIMPDGETPPATHKSFKQWTEKDFGDELKRFTEQHPKERLRAFFDYWREKSPSGKMRCQLERTWETQSRLETWARNEEIFNPNKKEVVKINSNEFTKQFEEAKKRLASK